MKLDIKIGKVTSHGIANYFIAYIDKGSGPFATHHISHAMFYTWDEISKFIHDMVERDGEVVDGK